MDFRDVIEHRVKARGTINQVKGGSSGNSVNAISFLDLGSTKALCQVAFSSNGFDILGQKCGFTEAESSWESLSVS